MARISINAKCRLCRAEGQKLYLKGIRCNSAKCPIDKKGAVKPGMHGAKGSKKPSDYGIQLRAKQKAKRIYGIQETQFRNYYKKAKNQKGLIGDNFEILIERRLDNCLYLAGIASSRNQAKQFISHNHVYVNGKKLNISSYCTKLGDEISLDKILINKFADLLPVNSKDFHSPSWIDVDKAKYSAKITSLPTKQDINSGINTNLIVEYYSR
jgi:small subunit ribosomal protein S4